MASDMIERALDNYFIPWGAVPSSIKTETKTKIFTEQLFMAICLKLCEAH